MTEQPDQQSYATRRDEPGPYETRRDAAGAYETRRDARPASHATRQDRPPHRESGWADGARQESTSLLSLPPELAARYTVVGELPNPGTEADVLKVVDRAGTELVVKLYRRGMHADPAVWAKLDEIDSPHVVRFIETGTAAGRDYECMEYLGGGNLTALVNPPDTPLPDHLVTEVARQVTDGLIALHSLHLLHRDLKPENVLIRRRTPLELVVTDFGLARVLEQSVIAASRSGTVAYLAPELMVHGGGSQSRARDWWALGMIVRELLVGRRPFEEMLDASIATAIMLRGVDLSEVEDPRMQLLCRGLLTRDPDDRWGAAQVREWLAGGSPPVADSGSARDGVAGLPFAGKTYRGRPQLARALAGNWELAARRYFAMMGSHDNPSEGWRALREWLAGFENLSTGDLESRQELIDQWLLGSGPPDVKLVRLLRWLDPRQAPIYREFSVAPEHLSALTAAAAEPQSPAARVVGDLWRYDLLPVLADFSAGGPLRGIHARWHELHDEWTRVDAQLRPLLPPAAVGIGGGAEQASLLALAADPAEAEQELRKRVAAGLAALPVRLNWLEQVVQRGGQSPLAMVTVLRLLPEATRESHELAQREAVTRAQWEARQRRWQERERARQAGAGVAQTRALIPLVVWSVVMAALALASISTASPGVAAISFLAAAGAAAVALASELGLVKELGGDYHPGYSIGSRIGPLFSRFRARGVGGAPGCLILFGVLAGVSLILYFPPVLFSVVGVWHFSTVLERRRLWRAAHQQEARNAGVAG